MEVETQLIIASKLGYLDKACLDTLLGNCGRVKQMLYKLMQSLAVPIMATQKPTPSRTGKGRRGTGNDL